MSEKSLNDQIRHYQRDIDKCPENSERMLRCIKRLYVMPIKVEHLQETGVGRSVNGLRKFDGEVGDAATALVSKWKAMVAAEDSECDQEVDEAEEEMEDYENTDSTNYNGSFKEERLSHPDRLNGIKENKNNDCSVRKESVSKSSSKHDSSRHSKHHSDKRKTDKRSHSENKDKSDRDKSTTKDKSSVKKSSESSKHSRDHVSKHSSKSNSEKKGSNVDKHSFSVHKKHDSGSMKSHSHSSSRHSSSSKSHRDHGSSREDKKSHGSSRHKRKHSEERNNSLCKKSKVKQEVVTSDDGSEEEDESDSEEETSEEESESENGLESSSDEEDEKSFSSNGHIEIKKERTTSDSDTSSEHSSQEKRTLSNHHSSSHSKHQLKESKSAVHHEKSPSHHSKSSNRHHHHHHSKSSSHHSSSSDKKMKQLIKENEKNIKKEKEVPKKSEKSPKKTKVNVNSDGSIDAGCGASFGDALLGLPVKNDSKKKKKIKETSHKTSLSPGSNSSYTGSPSSKVSVSSERTPRSIQDLMKEPELLTKRPKQEVLDISSTLPEINPNYRPLPHPPIVSRRVSKSMSEEEAMFSVMTTKNQRTKVFSGCKSVAFTNVPSLYDFCIQVLYDNIEGLEYTGGVPYDILQPLLSKLTADQLLGLEHYNPYLVDDTDNLWAFHCKKEFRSAARKEQESWRDLYLRCMDERELKLKRLTANITESMAKSTPVRQAKLAYVDTVAKPPRNVARKQAKYGTGGSSSALVNETSSSSSSNAMLSAAAENAAKKKEIVSKSVVGAFTPATPATDVVSSSSAAVASSSGFNNPATAAKLLKKKKAPLMAKALQLVKNNIRYKR